MWLKRFFFIFLIISTLFLLSLCFIDKKTKPQKTFSKIFPSYQVPLKEKKLDLKKMQWERNQNWAALMYDTYLRYQEFDRFRDYFPHADKNP